MVQNAARRLKGRDVAHAPRPFRLDFSKGFGDGLSRDDQFTFTSFEFTATANQALPAASW
jgi:hypothetical protein